jgi:hypothetical protein
VYDLLIIEANLTCPEGERRGVYGGPAKAGGGTSEAHGRVVARAWQDESFKQRLLADAEGALADMGIKVPAGHEVRAVEDTERVRHLVIPPSPSEELSEEQLDQVAGGGEYCSPMFCTPELGVCA